MIKVIQKLHDEEEFLVEKYSLGMIPSFGLINPTYKTLVSPFPPQLWRICAGGCWGYQIVLNYRGGAKHFQVVSLRDVLNDRLPPEWGRWGQSEASLSVDTKH